MTFSLKLQGKFPQNTESAGKIDTGTGNVVYSTLKKLKLSGLTVCASMILSGCVTTGSTNLFGDQGNCQYNTGAFVVGGAVAGVALGALLGAEDEKLIGAGIAGAAVGGVTQQYLQYRCQQIQALQQRAQNVQIAASSLEYKTQDSGGKTSKEEGVALTVVDQTGDGLFQPGSSRLTAVGEANIREVARIFRGTQKQVLITAHTDPRGDYEVNLRLSEKRANAVAKIFVEEGVLPDNIYIKGVGPARQTAKTHIKNGQVDIAEIDSEQGIKKHDKNKRSEATSNRATYEQDPANLLKAKKPGKGIDFGGKALDSRQVAFDSRHLAVEQSTVSQLRGLIGVSQATGVAPENCIFHKREGDIKNYKTGESLYTWEYLKGYYSQPWEDQDVNNHYVALKVHVPRSNKEKLKSKIWVYENFQQGQKQQTIETEGYVDIQSYKDNILYRVFYDDDAWPVRCLDLLLPKSFNGNVIDGYIQYDKDGSVHFRQFRPKTY